MRYFYTVTLQKELFIDIAALLTYNKIKVILSVSERLIIYYTNIEN